jgi:EF hand
MSGAQTPSSTNKEVPKLPPSFLAADQNKDGYVSKDEAKKVGISPINFDAADKNKDNKINLSEWTLLKF